MLAGASVNAFGFQHLGGCEHVVTPKGNGLKLANAPLVTIGGVESYAGLCAGNEEFNPALLNGERLIGDHFQSQSLCIEFREMS